MFKLISSTSLMLCLCAAGAWADHGKGAVGGKTVSPMTLHERDASLELGFRFRDEQSISDADILTAVGAGHDTHSSDYLFEVSLSLAYGITDQLSVSLSLPFTYIRNFRGSEDGIDILTAGSISGFGDLTALAKYALIQGPLNVSVIGGLQIPTGFTSAKDDNGDPLELDHQPGSGCWSPILGVSVGLSLDERITLIASLVWRIAIQGQQGFRPGDDAILAAKVEYQVTELGDAFPRVYLSLEISVERVGMDRDSGTPNGDSGGYTLAIGPGLRARLGERLSAGLTFSIPVDQYLYGIQHHQNYEILSGMTLDF